MLKTPPNFEPLITPQAHPDPINYIFNAGRLLHRADGTLPRGDEGLHAIDPARLHPVGLLEGRYCQTAWADGACSSQARR